MSAPVNKPALRPHDHIVTEAEIEELGLEMAEDDIGPSDDETDEGDKGKTDGV